MNKNKGHASSYLIPADFPRTQRTGTAAEDQSAVLLSCFEGKFYEKGCTPPELFARWDLCDNLVQQFALKCVDSKNGNRSHMTPDEILKHFHARLSETNWVSRDEAIWVFRRVAQLMNWVSPI